MAFPAEDHFVLTVRTLENIKAKIKGIAKHRFLNIIKNTGTKLASLMHLNKPVVMIP